MLNKKMTKSESRVKNTLMNTTLGIITKLVIIITNFVTRTVFIKYLGIEYTGVSSVFSNILTVLSFAELGIGSAITFALYKPIEEKDNFQIAKVMNLYKTAYRIIAATVFIAGLCLVPFLDKLVTNVPNVKENITVIFILYIVNTASSYLLIYKSTLLTASQQSYIISGVNTLFTIIRTIVQLCVIIIFRQFLLYLIIQIVSTMLQNYVCSRMADKQFCEINNYKDARLTKNEKKRIFKDIKALSLYKISGTVLTGTDSIIISSMLSTALVGYVSNYGMIINEIYNIILQFLNALTASVGNLVASKNARKQFGMFKILNFSCQYFFCVCTVCLICLIEEFVGNVWLGEAFIIDYWTMLFLCIDFYLKGNATLVNTFRNANGLFVQGQYRPLIMAIINIVVSIWGVKVIGLPGVFLGTVISRLFTQVWYDPIVLYKYAFNQKAFSYFFEYLVWILVLLGATVISKYLISVTVIRIGILSFTIHGVICVLVTSIIVFIVFWKTNRIQTVYRYICSIVKKKKA